MPRKTQRTRTSAVATQVSGRSSKRSKSRATSTGLSSSKRSAKEQRVYTCQLVPSILQGNGSKTRRSVPCLKLTRKELVVLLHTCADTHSLHLCASLKKTTTGMRLAEELRQAHQKWKTSNQPNKTTILSDFC